jgi:glycerol-3-phosphate dehydrogenase
VGAKLLDKNTNKEIKVKTHSIINATGVFADRIRKKDNPNALNRIIPVEGSHLILPLKFSSKKNAILIPETEDGRVLFLIPWERSLLIGTTDKKYGEPVINPTSTIEEIAFLAKEIHKIYPYLEISDIIQNIQSKWAGLRPLVYEIPRESTNLKGGNIDTKSVSRKHVLEESGTGKN